MKLSSSVGLVLGMGVVLFATMGATNSRIFLNQHAIVIVLGGTLAAALVCFPAGQLFVIFRVFLGGIVGEQQLRAFSAIEEVVSLARMVQDGKPLSSEMGKVSNPFLKEALTLLENGGLSDEELDEILIKRIQLQNERYRRDSMVFKTVGKFPPAFGLVGTSVGMITLLQSLGEPGAYEKMGPSMALALVATFYGLILANVFLIPAGENLLQLSEKDLVVRRIVADGIRLLREKKHPFLVEEYLKSYLSPKERNKMDKAFAA